ncbi:MAG: anti-sigma factor domain-containing protein [Candidatus Binatia bacterium]
MKTHEDYREALALHALRSLAEPERRDVEAHLETCPTCLVELAELRESAGNLVLLAKPRAPSADHLERLLDALPSTGGEASRVTERRMPTPPSPARRGLRGFLKSRPVVWTARLAVAAVLVLLTFSQLAMLERLDRAYIEMARMRAIGEFVTSPGVSMVPLWGTDVARAAHAKLAYEHATGRFMLFSSRIPPPPAGRSYQLWVISDRVRLAAAFSPESPDGTLRALPTGDAPFLFGVSLEPESAAESAEPSGGMVLMSAPVRHPR